MSTIVYQEFSQRDYSSSSSSSLSLKLNNPSKLTFSSNNKNNNKKDGSWSAIESLCSTQKEEKETVYVHPLAKRSSYSKMSMSDKSLEMCTESLGCETGAFFSDIYFYPSLATTVAATNSSNSCSSQERIKEVGSDFKHSSLSYSKSRNTERNNSFPPPLTTMSGSNSIQVRPYREEGRLVIEAVLTPSNHSCLKAERSEGRLRLSLVREVEEEVEEEEEEVEEVEEVEEEDEGNIVINNYEKKEVGEREEEKEEARVKLSRGKIVKSNHNEFQRPSTYSWRCKEGGRGNINWEPFWVAT